MHFPSALKLVAAVLLSAIVANAAPALPKTVVVKELLDSYGAELWLDFTGYSFQYVEDGDADAQFNPEPSKYALYKVENWMEGDRTMVEPVFGLTKENGEEINEWSLKEDIVVLESGFSDGRFWVVWTPSKKSST